MIKLENVVLASPEQMAFIIQGMRNPMNSWDKSDSEIVMSGGVFVCGDNDIGLMQRLAKAGTDHRKFMRMMPVYVRITAPLYWWKEFDTNKVGTVVNSCSTMHKIQEKAFTLEDFSYEHLIDDSPLDDNETKELEETLRNCDDYPASCVMEDGYFSVNNENGYLAFSVTYRDTSINTFYYSTKSVLETFIIPVLNANREAYLKTKDKKYWWQMIQLLPSSYNQTRNVMLNYEVLANIYKSRKDHKLDEWREFCKWIEELPYHELITD